VQLEEDVEEAVADGAVQATAASRPGAAARQPRDSSTISSMLRWLLVLVGASSITAAVVVAQDSLRSDAASMQKKVKAIAARGEKPPAKSAPALRTSFTDREANAYFKVHGAEFLPVGVLEPQVVIDEGGKVRGRAIVDIDQAWKDRSWLFSWIGGKVEVVAVGTLRAANGQGVFAIENTTLGGVSVPLNILQTLVSFYTKTPEHPRGFELDQPFALPSAIQSVDTRKGAATVVQ